MILLNTHLNLNNNIRSEPIHETATTSGEEHAALPPKVSKAKEITKKGQKLHQNWLLIRMPQNVLYIQTLLPKETVNQNATKHA